MYQGRIDDGGRIKSDQGKTIVGLQASDEVAYGLFGIGKFVIGGHRPAAVEHDDHVGGTTRRRGALRSRGVKVEIDIHHTVFPLYELALG